jgi:hypothetical protein
LARVGIYVYRGETMARWTVNTAVLRLPVTDHRGWDADAADRRARKWVSDKDPSEWGASDWRRYKTFFLVYDAENPHKFESYKLPVADVVDGKPTVIRRAVIAAQQALAGARRGVDLPDEVKKRAMKLAERLREKADKVVAEGED